MPVQGRFLWWCCRCFLYLMMKGSLLCLQCFIGGGFPSRETAYVNLVIESSSLFFGRNLNGRKRLSQVIQFRLCISRSTMITITGEKASPHVQVKCMPTNSHDWYLRVKVFCGVPSCGWQAGRTSRNNSRCSSLVNVLLLSRNFARGELDILRSF